MKVVNFAHALSSIHIEQLNTLLAKKMPGEQVEKVIQVPVFFDVDAPFAPQVEELLAHIPKDETVLINPPALNIIAYILCWRLMQEGRMHPIIRLKKVRVSGSSSIDEHVMYDVAEIVWLENGK